MGQNWRDFKEWSDIVKCIVAMSAGNDVSVIRSSWNPDVRIFT